MSDLEDQLLGSEDEEEAPKPKRENSTIKQMREALEAQKAELEQARERNQRFETTFLSQAGLSEKQAAALRAAGYEASPDGIEAFRSEVLGVTPPPAEEPKVEQPEAPVEEEEAPAPGFSPTRVGGEAPAKTEYTSNDLVELFQTDPVKADKLVREGRVKRQKFNPGGPAF